MDFDQFIHSKAAKATAPNFSVAVKVIKLGTSFFSSGAENNDKPEVATPKAAKVRIKFNQNHDEKGRFASGDGGSSSSTNGVDKSGNVTDTAAFYAANSPNLSPAERISVASYASNDYAAYNQNLRDNNTQMIAMNGTTFSNIDSAIGKSPVSNDITVYRGMTLSPDQTFSPGDIITDKAYVSTTLDKNTAYSFAATSQEGAADMTKTVATISVSKGQDALAVSPAIADIANSSKAAENEMLLPRDSSFRVTSFTRGSADPASRSTAAVSQLTLEKI